MPVYKVIFILYRDRTLLEEEKCGFEDLNNFIYVQIEKNYAQRVALQDSKVVVKEVFPFFVDFNCTFFISINVFDQL